MLRMLLLGTAMLGAAGVAHAELRVEQVQRLKEISVNEARGGSLLLPSATPGRYVQAPLLATDIDIDISGPTARTRVTQRFTNSSDKYVEGTYVFPLPERSAVDVLRMQVGERFIEGEIKEKIEAKAIYETAKAEGKTAALVEQLRPNLFTNAVANIGPGETVIVQIEYGQTLVLDGDVFSLRVPTVAAPRYHPAPQTKLVSLDGAGFASLPTIPDSPVIGGPINPVSFDIDLEAGFPLGRVESSSHALDVDRVDDDTARIEIEAFADRDFVLRWAPQSLDAPEAALFSEDVAGKSHYLFMLTPPAPSSAPVPRDVTFVIDTSGSMQGASIRQAREALSLAIGRLSDRDRFEVIAFSNTHRSLFGGLRAADGETRHRAQRWVDRLEAGGGTEMLPALKTAMRIQTGANLQQVVFLTDGAIGNEDALFSTLDARRGRARVFTIGIGSAPNTHFMSRAAEIGQGAFTHIGQVDEVAARMGEVFAKLENPAVTDLRLRWPDGTEVEAWPDPIPDLYQGETLTVAAKSGVQSGTAWLSGVSGDQPWKIGLDLDQASGRPGIAKLWARDKIAALELARAQGKPQDGELLRTALDYGLVSRLTSLVAVDVVRSRPKSEALMASAQPLALPDGWDWGGVMGVDGTARAIPSDALVQARDEARDEVGTDVQMRERGADLPQTSTSFLAKLLAGLAILLACTWQWTRPVRRYPV